MTPGANLHDVEALQSLHAALARFGVQAQGALDTAAGELRRAYDFLDRKDAYWKQEVVRRQEDFNRAKADLSRQRWLHDGERVGSSEAEIAVHRARERLREAEDKVQAVRRWRRLLPEAAGEYEGKARRLAGTLEADLRVGLALLESRAAALAAYLEQKAPIGGR